MMLSSMLQPLSLPEPDFHTPDDVCVGGGLPHLGCALRQEAQTAHPSSADQHRHAAARPGCQQSGTRNGKLVLILHLRRGRARLAALALCCMRQPTACDTHARFSPCLHYRPTRLQRVTIKGGGGATTPLSVRQRREGRRVQKDGRRDRAMAPTWAAASPAAGVTAAPQHMHQRRQHEALRA